MIQELEDMLLPLVNRDTKCAVINYTGYPIVTTPGFIVDPADFSIFVNLYDPKLIDDIRNHGIFFKGESYIIAHSTDEYFALRRSNKGIILAKGDGLIVVAFYSARVREELCIKTALKCAKHFSA